jgi:hypothetical protein
MRRVATMEERFWRFVTKTDGCWLWRASSRNENGYGVLGRTGRGTGFVKAHRFSWELHRGPIPVGLLVLHACDVPSCVNPDHLSLGTHADNSADCRRKWRTKHGDYGFAPTLRTDQVAFIRDAYAAGFSTHRLAAVFGVTGTSIARYVRGTARRAA